MYVENYSLSDGVRLPEAPHHQSTRDDRAHPDHARKMAAKMAAMGCHLPPPARTKLFETIVAHSRILVRHCRP